MNTGHKSCPECAQMWNYATIYIHIINSLAGAGSDVRTGEG